jgi:hypothetical protein
MANDTDDADTAANRLEAALERIAQAMTHEEPTHPDGAVMPDGEVIAARLDGLIDRLRSALGGKPD